MTTAELKDRLEEAHRKLVEAVRVIADADDRGCLGCARTHDRLRSAIRDFDRTMAEPTATCTCNRNHVDDDEHSPECGRRKP